MFDIGFWELALIGLVALLVVGPERLPKVARTAGKWIGRGRRLVQSVKADIDREIKAEELKEILERQARHNPLEEIQEIGHDLDRSLRGTRDSAEAPPPKADPPPPKA